MDYLKYYFEKFIIRLKGFRLQEFRHKAIRCNAFRIHIIDFSAI